MLPVMAHKPLLGAEQRAVILRDKWLTDARTGSHALTGPHVGRALTGWQTGTGTGWTFSQTLTGLQTPGTKALAELASP